MWWILCYDVVENRRRSKFHRKLKRYLVPVQMSVFEGRLTPQALGEVEELVMAELDLTTDSVRLYPLTSAGRGMVVTFGTAVQLPDPDAPVIL